MGTKTTGQMASIHLVVVSQETGEQTNPKLSEFKRDALIVANMGIFIEIVIFLLDLRP